MSDDDVKEHSDSLLAFIVLGGSPKLWWESKDFSPEDRDLILTEAAQKRPQPYV